jgi:pimeloyl-ACP methyl ester carboxylesterase
VARQRDPALLPGAGQWRPIVCIHGAGGTALAWADAVDTLVRLGRVIAYRGVASVAPVT